MLYVKSYWISDNTFHYFVDKCSQKKKMQHNPSTGSKILHIYMQKSINCIDLTSAEQVNK